ncbi:hypothetical protein EJV47_10145 [Hymenobacter gummosus]|uniref:Outer membrane protein beta-barrel domain-containing protein n=1 Tax=Hymenobacter gummosus TaxID=1776032 RepID=A0A3S0H5B7_9BACT|nr:hypothetical protein [Hymenobacter gummosus]RTQ49995.1 hypothetical protein EJV47_10145 [Hymenobacter gummosus]
MLTTLPPARPGGRLLTALLLGLLPLAAPAQGRFSFAAGAGAGISLDRLHAPDGLPPRVRYMRRLSGPVVALGVRYALRPRWQLTMDVRGAAVRQGFKVQKQVLQRDANGQVTAWLNGSSQQGFNRPQLTSGVRYLLGRPGSKLRLAPELGLGYMVDVSYYDPEWVQGVGLGGRPNYVPEEEIHAWLPRELVRRGNWGGYAGLGAHWQLSPHSALAVDAYSHHGVLVMSELRATYFRYINNRDNVVRDYRVTVSNRGSYVAAKATYCYTL